MNQILVRTNRGEYAGGSTVYGAVYLQLVEPVVADTVVVSFLGEETCSWKKFVPVHRDGRSRAVSQNSTDTGFQEGLETNSMEVTFREVVFSGKLTHVRCDIKLKDYPEGVIPLGCYAFPFQLALKAGLPNSFEKVMCVDDVKRSSYSAQVSYTLTAMLKNSKSRNESSIKSSSKFVLRHEEFMTRSNTVETYSARKIIWKCSCFKKGEIALFVTLDKKLFTLGETMHVKFQVENKSNEQLSTARIRLFKTIGVAGTRDDDEGKQHKTNETFHQQELCTVPLEMGTVKSKSFDVPIFLQHSENDIVATSSGSIVKCRCYLEVELELDVLLDSDLSVIVPIEIYPNSAPDWEKWTAPDWVRDVKVVDSVGVCAVPRHILVSTEYHNVPLPLAGL